MRLFESQPEWLRDPAPAAPSIPYAIPVPVASSPGLLRRCVMAMLMLTVAVSAGAFVSPYLPKPHMETVETSQGPAPAAPMVEATQPPKSPPTSVLPVVTPIAPVSTVVVPEVTPQLTVAIPTPSQKPKAIVVEEQSIKAKPFFADKKNAAETAKREGKRVLYWINGADEIPESETLIKSLGDHVVHCKLDGDGTDYDSVGPRLAWTGEDGKRWFTRASKVNSGTTNNIRSKMGLPTITADGREVKFPQVVPPQESRYRNFSDRTNDGNCLWVATDTLLKTHGYNVSLSKNRWGGSDIPHAVSALQQRGVKFAYRGHFTPKDREFLQCACDEGCGCVVTILCGPNMGHAIDLVGIDEKRVAIIDNNDPELKTRITSRESFEAIWDGGAIAILPRDYAGKLTQRVMQCPGGQCPAPSLPRSLPGGQFDADSP